MAYDFNGLAKDKYTLALLRFNDENDPYKDECGNVWEKVTAIGDASLQAEWKSDSTVGGYLDLNQEGAIRTKSIDTEKLFNDDFTIDFWCRGQDGSTKSATAKMLISCSPETSSHTALEQGIQFWQTGDTASIRMRHTWQAPSRDSINATGTQLYSDTFKYSGTILGKSTIWRHIALVRYYNALLVFVDGTPTVQLKYVGSAQRNYIGGKIINLTEYIYVGNRSKVTSTKNRLCIKNLRISNVARWTGMQEGSNTATTTFNATLLNSMVMNDDLITQTEDKTQLYTDFYTKSLLRFNDKDEIKDNTIYDIVPGIEWEAQNVYLTGRNALCNKGLHFNGSTSMVKMKKDLFKFGGEDLTVDFWMYRSRSMILGTVTFCFYNSKNTNSDFILYSICPQQTNHLNLVYNNDSVHIGKNNSALDQKPYNKLDHFAFVYNHNIKEIAVYLNGHLIQKQSNFNLDETYYDGVYIGYIPTQAIIESEQKEYSINAATTISDFRISNIVRWTNEFYDGLDLNGNYKAGRTIYDNIREAQMAENPNAVSPIKKDVFTLALLHFDDANDPYKDECGNTWVGYGNSASSELPTTTDFHSVYGNSCITFNNTKKQAIVLKNPDGSLLEFGGEDFTIDMWVYSNGDVPVGARIFSIYNTSLKGVSLSNRYSSTQFVVYPVLYGNSVSEADTSTDKFAGGTLGYYSTYLCGRKVHMAVVYYHHQKCLVYYQDGKMVLRITGITIPKTQWPQISIGAIYSGSTFSNYFLGEIDDFRISNIARYTGEFDIEPGDIDETYTQEKVGYSKPDLDDEDLAFLMRFDKKFKTDPEDTIWLDWKQGIEMQQGSVINKDLINNPKNTNTTTFTTLVPAGLKYDNNEIYSRSGNACYFNGSSYLRSATPVTLPSGDWTIDWFQYDLSTQSVNSGVFCLLPKSSSFNSRNTNIPTATGTTKCSIISVGRTSASTTTNNILYVKTMTTCFNYITSTNSSYKVVSQYRRLFDTLKGKMTLAGTKYKTPVAASKIDYSIGNALNDSNKPQLIHWAIVKKGNTLSVYRQGQRTFIFDAGVDKVDGVDPDKKLNDFAGTYDLYLGIALADGTNNMASDTNLRKKAMYYTFNGYIDDFRISNRALFTTNFDVLPHPKPENYYQMFEAL